MTTAELARRFFEEQDRLRGGPAPELCAPGYQAWLGGNPPVGREGHEGFARAFYAAFDDLHHVIEEVIADGNRAAVRFVLRGSHTGSFLGVPPSGRRIEVYANVLLHMNGDRVAQLYGVSDEAGLLRQIGGASPGIRAKLDE
jgi:predicted ester cyclase